MRNVFLVGLLVLGGCGPKEHTPTLADRLAAEDTGELIDETQTPVEQIDAATARFTRYADDASNGADLDAIRACREREMRRIIDHARARVRSAQDRLEQERAKLRAVGPRENA